MTEEYDLVIIGGGSGGSGAGKRAAGYGAKASTFAQYKSMTLIILAIVCLSTIVFICCDYATVVRASIIGSCSPMNACVSILEVRDILCFHF